MVRERPTSNWLIGVGYLLIALIVLVNYAFPKERKTDKKTEKLESENLSEQLQAERKKNSEMSEMIARLQSYLEEKKQPESAPDPEVSPVVKAVAVEDWKIYVDKDYSNWHQTYNRAYATIFPKDGPKNPFSPFYEVTDQKSVQFGGKKLRLMTDSKIPLTHLGTWNKPKVFDSLQ